MNIKKKVVLGNNIHSKTNKPFTGKLLTQLPPPPPRFPPLPPLSLFFCPSPFLLLSFKNCFRQLYARVCACVYAWVCVCCGIICGGQRTTFGMEDLSFRHGSNSSLRFGAFTCRAISPASLLSRLFSGQVSQLGYGHRSHGVNAASVLLSSLHLVFVRPDTAL